MKPLPILLPYSESHRTKKQIIPSTPLIGKGDALSMQNNYKLQCEHLKILLAESETLNTKLMQEIAVLRHSIASQNVNLGEKTVREFMDTIEKLQMKVHVLEGQLEEKTGKKNLSIYSDKKDYLCGTVTSGTLETPSNIGETQNANLEKKEPKKYERNDFELLDNEIDQFPDTDFHDISIIGSLLGDDPSQLLSRPIKVFQSASKEFVVDILDDPTTRCSTPFKNDVTAASTPIPENIVPVPATLESQSTSKFTSRATSPAWVNPLTCPSPTKSQLITERDALEEELIQRYAQLRMMNENNQRKK